MICHLRVPDVTLVTYPFGDSPGSFLRNINKPARASCYTLTQWFLFFRNAEQ